MKLMDPGRRRAKKCPIRSDCRARSNERYFNRLFRKDWDVFVIRHDPTTGKHVGTPENV